MPALGIRVSHASAFSSSGQALVSGFAHSSNAILLLALGMNRSLEQNALADFQKYFLISDRA
eukprot:646129-Pleurochrysis_carterae.AAC.3